MTTLGKLLGGPKDPVPPDDKCEVYKLMCKECPAVYIGETSRKLHIEVREHITNSDQKSAFGNHLKYAHHSLGDSILLHQVDSLPKRKALETIEIIKHKNKCTSNNANSIRLVNEFIPSQHTIEHLYCDSSEFPPPSITACCELSLLFFPHISPKLSL